MPCQRASTRSNPGGTAVVAADVVSVPAEAWVFVVGADWRAPAGLGDSRTTVGDIADVIFMRYSFKRSRRKCLRLRFLQASRTDR
jgi:hypothetical protein